MKRVELGLVLAPALVLALSLSTACSDATVVLESESAPAWQSGQRLQARIVAAQAGDARRFLHFIDTVIDQPCRLVQKTGDDRVYCRPAAVGQVVFLRDDCSDTPLVETWLTERAWVSSAFGEPIRLGAPVDSGGPRYFQPFPGQCVELTTGHAPRFEIAEQHTPDFLASGVTTSVAVDGVERFQFEGDDGSALLWGLVDTTTEQGCRPAETEAGPRCAPDVAEVSDEGLRNATCDHLYVAEYGSLGVARVTNARGAEGQLASDIFRFSPLPRETTVARLGENGECVVDESFQLGRKTLHLGRSYPSEAWPELRAVEGDNARLTAHRMNLPSGSAAGWGVHEPLGALFEDRVERSNCQAVWVDETLRCLPPRRWEASISAFANADCTERVLAALRGSTAPEIVTLIEDTATVDGGSLPIGAAWHVGAERSDGYVRTDTGDCRREGQLSYFALEGRVDAGRYAPLELSVER